MAEYIGAFVSNFTADPVMEGPQILLRWNLPIDTGSLNIRVLKKEKAYPDDENDGTILVNSPVASSPTSYVDLNPSIDTVWCYAAYIYYSGTQAWSPDLLYQQGAVVIPLASPTGYFYESQSRGLAGSVEPTWPTIIGSTVQDGDVLWRCIGVNPSWVTTDVSKDSAFTWDSEYMQRLLARKVPSAYRNADAESNQVKLSPQQDPDFYDVWSAIHETGFVARGEFERFLSIFGLALSRIRGAIDFYPRAVDPDETLPELLPMLAGLLGWELNTTLPTNKQRHSLMAAVPTYKIKGTTRSLEPSLRQAVGVNDVFVDPMSRHIMMSNRTTRLSAQGQLAGAYPQYAGAGSPYSRGDIVVPTLANRTGYYYQTRETGVAGGTEPTWPTIPGDVVADGTLLWRCVQFGVPHVTANVSIGATSITVDDTSPFEAGKTITIRDSVTPEGEQIVVLDIPSSTVLTLDEPTENSYTVANNALVSPAYDWYDDSTGFIWDIPVVDQFDGIYPDRVRVPGKVLDPSDIYSFEILRVWIILAAGEFVSTEELESLAKIMSQFAPADTSYVVRIEGP